MPRQRPRQQLSITDAFNLFSESLILLVSRLKALFFLLFIYLAILSLSAAFIAGGSFWVSVNPLQAIGSASSLTEFPSFLFLEILYHSTSILKEGFLSCVVFLLIAFVFLTPFVHTWSQSISKETEHLFANFLTWSWSHTRVLLSLIFLFVLWILIAILAIAVIALFSGLANVLSGLFSFPLLSTILITGIFWLFLPVLGYLFGFLLRLSLIIPCQAHGHKVSYLNILNATSGYYSVFSIISPILYLVSMGFVFLASIILIAPPAIMSEDPIGSRMLLFLGFSILLMLPFFLFLTIATKLAERLIPGFTRKNS